MRTILRKIGNSRGVLIPAALLAECGIQDEIELRREGTRLVIEPAPTTRAGWFDGYRADADPDAWAELPADADPAPARQPGAWSHLPPPAEDWDSPEFNREIADALYGENA